MPLPRPGSPWPPPALDPALRKFATWDAWWSGDTDELAGHYGSGRSITGRPGQYAGGVVGALSRMWWGRPPSAHEPAAKIHVPLGGDICRTSANLLFSEALTASSDHAATNDALDRLLDEGMQAKLLEAAEVQAALGGVYLRPVWDATLSDRAWLDAVAPDAAIPEWRWGRLAAVTFWRCVHEAEGWVWRHFERHEPGHIVHALYKGTEDSVGRIVPLNDMPDTEGFAGQVDEDGAIATGYDKLTASYVPNMLPNRRWRRTPALAPMGRSDLDGIEPILDALDETMSSWMRDVRLAKGRILVGDSMMDDHGPGGGATFDPDREAYAVVPGTLPKDVPLTVSQFDIRVEQHRGTAHELIVTALRHAGYALISLGEVEGGQAMTATEVKAKGQLSWVTRDRKIGYWRPVLEREALPALAVVDAAAFGRPMPDLTAPIRVEFADGIADDLATLAATAKTLKEAESASTAVRVRIIHPDWADDQVDEEVEAILDEAGGPAIAAPFDYGPGGQPGETDDQRAQLGDDQPDDDQPVDDEPVEGVAA